MSFQILLHIAVLSLSAHPVSRDAGRMPALTLRSWLSRPAGVVAVAAPDNNTPRPDPDPAPPPSFPPGFRPLPWQNWEIPQALRRFSLWGYVGADNAVRQATMLEMDNPNLYLTSSEKVEFPALWETNTFGITLQAGYTLFPLATITLDMTYFSFNREVSPPNIYVQYTDANNSVRLLNVENLDVFRACLCVRLELPVTEALEKAELLLRFKGAEERTGFLPFVLVGGGASYLGRVGANIYVNEAGTGRTEERDMFKSSFQPAWVAGIGLEYRLNFIGLGVRALLAGNGTPKSGWSPYTDDIDGFMTFHLQAGLGVRF